MRAVSAGRLLKKPSNSYWMSREGTHLGNTALRFRVKSKQCSNSRLRIRQPHSASISRVWTDKGVPQPAEVTSRRDAGIGNAVRTTRLPEFRAIWSLIRNLIKGSVPPSASQQHHLQPEAICPFPRGGLPISTSPLPSTRRLSCGPAASSILFARQDSIPHPDSTMVSAPPSPRSRPLAFTWACALSRVGSS